MERHSVHMLFFQCFCSLTCSTTAMTQLWNSEFLLVYRCYVFNQETPTLKMFKEESDENLVAIKLYFQGQLIKVICKKELIASLKKLSVLFRSRIIRYGLWPSSLVTYHLAGLVVYYEYVCKVYQCIGYIFDLYCYVLFKQEFQCTEINVIFKQYFDQWQYILCLWLWPLVQCCYNTNSANEVSSSTSLNVSNVIATNTFFSKMKAVQNNALKTTRSTLLCCVQW